MDDTSIGLTDLSEDIYVDVKAIKVGDVNSSYDDLQKAVTRSTHRIRITAVEREFSDEEDIEMVLNSDDSFVAQGLQLYLNINSDLLEFQYASWDGDRLSSAEVYQTEGALHLNVLRPEIDLTIDKLVLHFRSLAHGSLSKSINLKNAHLPNELINLSGVARSIDLIYAGSDDSQGPFDFHSAYPNPFVRDLTLSFDLMHEATMSISIMQSDGSLVFTTQKFFDAGEQELLLSDLQADMKPGMYFISMETNGERQSHSVLKIAP